MIKCTLPFQIFTFAQVKEIGKALNDEEGIDGLRRFSHVLNTETGKYVKTTDQEDFESGKLLAGYEAIQHIVDKNGLDMKPVKEIDIPYDVFFRTSPSQWDGICYLEARLEERCARYSRLKELNAPIIIMFNEARILAEYLESLESNFSKLRWAKDHTIIRSLNDIGFTLTANDWFDWKKEEIRKEEEKNQEEEAAEEG